MEKTSFILPDLAIFVLLIGTAGNVSISSASDSFQFTNLRCENIVIKALKVLMYVSLEYDDVHNQCKLVCYNGYSTSSVWRRANGDRRSDYGRVESDE